MGILSARCRWWIPLLQGRRGCSWRSNLHPHQAQRGPSCPAATQPQNTTSTQERASRCRGGRHGNTPGSQITQPHAIKEEIHLPQMLSGSLLWTPRESSSKGIVLYSILPWWFFSRDQHFLIRSDKYWVGGGEEKRSLIKHTNILLLLQKQG